jgi:lysophospholipase L1-like esterase
MGLLSALNATGSATNPAWFHPFAYHGVQVQTPPIAFNAEFIMAQNSSDIATITGISSQPIVLIGASYAKSWPIEKIHDVDIINRGVAGEQSSEMLARFKRDVVAANPSHVIIWGFINDIFRSEQSELESKLELTKTNIEQMVQISHENQIIPILATEVTIRSPSGIKETLSTFFYGTILGKSSYQDYVNHHIEQVNQSIRDFAAKNQLSLLDFETLLAGEDGSRRKTYATQDGSHISLEGYEALTRYVQEKLLPVIEKATTD